MRNYLLIETENGVVTNVVNYGEKFEDAKEELIKAAHDNLEGEWVQEYVESIKDGEWFVDWVDSYGIPKALTIVAVECI